MWDLLQQFYSLGEKLKPGKESGMKELLKDSELQQMSHDNESFLSVYLKNVNRYYCKS